MSLDKAKVEKSSLKRRKYQLDLDQRVKRVAQVNISQRMCWLDCVGVLWQTTTPEFITKFSSCPIVCGEIMNSQINSSLQTLEIKLFQEIVHWATLTEPPTHLVRALGSFFSIRSFPKNYFLHLNHSQQEKGNARRELTTSPSGMDDSELLFNCSVIFAARGSERYLRMCKKESRGILLISFVCSCRRQPAIRFSSTVRVFTNGENKKKI